jgi:hypothetical protein
MEAQRLGVRHAVVLLPPLGRAVAARGHQPVEHREEDRPLDAEAEATRRQLGAQHVANSRLAPEAIEHQARPHSDGFGRQGLALRMGVEHDDFLGEPSEALDQRIELPGRPQLIESTEPMEHALDQATLDALVFHEEQVSPGAVGLRADEHGVPP